MLKRTTAAILALVMIIGLLPILPASTTAYAANSGSCGDNITWSFSGDTLTVTGYGAMTDYNDGDETPWADLHASIKKIVFKNTGSGITSIGSYAFDYCYNLTDVTVPPTLKKVGCNAFFECYMLKNISLPESVAVIESNAFGYCKSLTKVPSDSKLKYVTELGSGVFNSCEGITEAVFPPSLKEIPDFLYTGCNSLTEVIIPEYFNVIGQYAFNQCTGLKQVMLNTGVTEVRAMAFYGCTSLEKVIICNPLTMKGYSFGDCPSTVNYHISLSQSEFKSKSNIDNGNEAFYDASLSYGTSYTVVLHPNGGTGGVFGAEGRSVMFTKNIGEAFTFSTDDSYIPLGKYRFLGWNTKPDGSGSTFSPGEKYNGNATLNLYAQWAEPPIKRLFGNSRNGTAVAISNEVEKTMSRHKAVVLANGWNFADALAGGPLAYALDAPILLITGDDNDAETYAEIERLGAKDIFILGGKGAIGEDVEAKLKKDRCYVERIAGDNRFETAVKIAEAITDAYGGGRVEAIFAYSHNYPDALAISGIAASMGTPILYIDSDGVLDPATKAYVSKSKFDETYIVGGTGAISSAAESNILSAGAKNVERIYGSTRYETCLEINKKFALMVNGGSICVSTGTNFPDALAGGVLAARKYAPMLLVAPDEPLSAEQKNYIKNNTKDKVYIFGGKVAIPEAIENEIETLVS